MAYITGTVNSYDELLSVLVSGCQDRGWTWADGILSKGAAFVKVTVSPTAQTGSGTPGSGIYIQGGTGQSGATLSGASSVQPRLGRPRAHENFAIVTWPASYHLHIFTDPDEVFLILNFDTQYCYWLAFGVSNVGGLPGTGLWLAGTAPVNAPVSATSGSGFGITPTTGTAFNGAGFMVSGFLTVTSRNNTAALSFDGIHADFDGLGWAGTANATSQNAFNAWYPAAPHLAMTPSSWNQDAPLLPIHGYVWRPENKCSLVLAVQNARYIRVDNYEVGDEITLGTDKWRPYPFYLKNATVRDGGTYLNHTGTFGWAIRSN